MSKNAFDERQQLECGKAFRNAFFAMFGALLICGLINSILDKPIFDYFAMMLIPIWISVSVFLTTVIKTNAIDGMNQSGGWNLISVVWGIAGAFVLAASVIKLTQEPPLVNGALNEYVVQAFNSLCMLEVFAAYRIKRVKDAKKVKAEEEA